MIRKDKVAEILILDLRRVVALMEAENAAAKRENALGGWLSDHAAAIQEFDKFYAVTRKQLESL